jgi:vancomycin permeability regulator SanA
MEDGGESGANEDPTGRPGPPSRRRRRVRRVGLVLGGMAVAGLIAVVGANVVVARGAQGLAHDEVAAVPHRTVALVFGAGVDPGGRPTPALADRLSAAIALYRAGRVDHLLLSGDNSRQDYDEVSAMRDVVLAAGVPAERVTRDYAGFDTYDSCARAVSIFGVRDAVLVTQDFHLPRALYLCRHQGIDAVGLAVPDWQHRPERSGTDYPLGLRVSYTLREWLARTKSVADAQVLHRPPAIGGPFEGLRAT